MASVAVTAGQVPVAICGPGEREGKRSGLPVLADSYKSGMSDTVLRPP